MIGIIFDLDGTLWEVIDSTYKSVNEICEKYNLDSVSRGVICSCFGLDKYETARKYFSNIDTDRLMELLKEIADININNLRNNGGNIYEGVKETIKRLSYKYKLYIVSNTAEKEYIEAFLESSNLNDYFDDYIAAGEINITKSEAIKKVIKDNNLTKAIYVGDTINDYTAANEASIPFVYAEYGFGKKFDNKYVISSFKELPYLIDNIIKE